MLRILMIFVMLSLSIVPGAQAKNPDWDKVEPMKPKQAAECVVRAIKKIAVNPQVYENYLDADRVARYVTNRSRYPESRLPEMIEVVKKVAAKYVKGFGSAGGSMFNYYISAEASKQRSHYLVFGLAGKTKKEAIEYSVHLNLGECKAFQVRLPESSLQKAIKETKFFRTNVKY